jgi:adenylate cyclase
MDRPPSPPPIDSAGLSGWIAGRVLAGDGEHRILEGVCERLVQSGVRLRRAVVGADTLHPVLRGRVFEWRRDREQVKQTDYGRGQGIESEESWRRSPFFHLFMSGETRMRRRLVQQANAAPEFPVFADLIAEGMTDYVAYCHRLGETAVVGDMDCIFSSWTTDRAGGFRDEDLDALDGILPSIAAAFVGISLGRIANTLVETYLGRDAGRRVLAGSIARGVAERIKAVLWHSDLKGFTRLVDTVAPELVIPMLNDYAGAVVSAVEEAGGQVLKFIGDGVLATFAMGDPEGACRQALDAVSDALQRIEALNRARAARGAPTAGFYLALHVGEVFYGNIGSEERLDFTVIGPAVNELTRIAGMSRSLDQDVMLSQAFAEAAGAERARLVSLGRYALRGIDRPQELFTLDRTAARE